MIAATAPWLHKRLIKKSKWHDPFLKQDWDAATFEDIDWKGMWSSFGCLTKGQQFQLSKYAHNWTPTLHQRATQDNSIDRPVLPVAHGRKILITSYAAQATDE
jgi:hypothetical protein